MGLNGFLKRLFNRKATVDATVHNVPEFPPGVHYRKFYDYLYITKLYCDNLLKNNDNASHHTLRNINPLYDNKEIFKFRYSSYEQTEWTIRPFSVENDSLISELFATQLSRKSEAIFSFEGVEKIKGKILIADFDESVVDGASESVSEGFIDGYDIPPIDTWIYLIRKPDGLRRIYSWVPAQFVNLVQEAIDINAVDCLSWHDNSA